MTLSSGKEADYYVNLRRATLHHEAAPLIGSLIREADRGLGLRRGRRLTTGADPVAAAIMHAPAVPSTPSWSARR